ncbi:MAG: 50S ribosomal protein L4 [Bacillota bacterium]
MPTVDVRNMQGNVVGQIELAESVFGIEANEHVMHQAVVRYLASQRLGTHDVKNRSEVRGGGKKPWRQKGMGRARQGSRRSPQWRGGGVVFGPTPRSYKLAMPRKVRRLALKSALSTKLQNGELIILDQLTIDQPRTKTVIELLKVLQAENALLVTGEVVPNLVLSSRNIPGVLAVDANNMNVYEILRHKSLILTRDAVAKVEEVLA